MISAQGQPTTSVASPRYVQSAQEAHLTSGGSMATKRANIIIAGVYNLAKLSQKYCAGSFTFNEYSVTCCITNSCYNRNRCRDDQRTRTTYNKCGKPKVCPIGTGSSHNEWRKNGN